jgi:predicted patatin/cPLA2 family phospholipase
MIKGLVISGGGCKGAFAAGILYKNKKEYDKYYGTSTGSLNVLLAAVGKYEELKENFIVNNEDIYDINPFNKKNKLSLFKAFIRFIKRKKTIATTNKLLKKIRELYTEDDHNRLEEKEIIVTVTNLTTRNVEYKSSSSYSWEDFTYWVWVSTLAYPYAETVFINGYEYGDGGFSVNLPIKIASEDCEEIDTIVLVPEKQNENFENQSILNGITSIVHLLLATSMNKDISNGKKIRKSKINWHFTPYTLTALSMYFDKKQMTEWFNLGKTVKL